MWFFCGLWLWSGTEYGKVWVLYIPGRPGFLPHDHCSVTLPVKFIRKAERWDMVRAEAIIFGEISLWKPNAMQQHDVVRVRQHRDVCIYMISYNKYIIYKYIQRPKTSRNVTRNPNVQTPKKNWESQRTDQSRHHESSLPSCCRIPSRKVSNFW